MANALISARRHIRIFAMLFLIVGIALFTRLYALSVIPTGISDDEILFPLSGRSFYYTGKDLTEQWSPFSSVKPPSNIIQVFGKVPYILFAPYFASVKFSLLTARFPYALLGSLFVLVLFMISKKLFSDKEAYIIVLLYAINPWSIFFSRTAYEAPLGVYFGFTMFAILLYANSWRIMLAFPFYILSLYSYIGTPVVLPFFALIGAVHSWLTNQKKYPGYYLFFLLLCGVTMLVYMIRLPNDVGGNKSSQLLSPYSESVSSSVNFERTLTIPSRVTSVFINKYENVFRRFIVQYAGAFSPAYLFVRGEDQARFSLDSHGLFYLIDVLFFVYGFAMLLNHKNRVRTAMIVALLLVAPIPSAISGGDTQYVLRSAFLFPVILCIIGFGIYETIRLSKNHTFAAVAVSIVYGLSFINFGYLYLYKNPVANYDSFGVSGRIVARYVELSGLRNRSVEILFRGTNKGLLKQYLFFSNRYMRENHSVVASLYTAKIAQIDNVTFADCEDRSADETVTTIIPFNFVCIPKKSMSEVLNITNYVTNQPMYVIYNDSVCKNYPVSPFLHSVTLGDFNIESMSEQDFCRTFFTRDSSYLLPK